MERCNRVSISKSSKGRPFQKQDAGSGGDAGKAECLAGVDLPGLVQLSIVEKIGSWNTLTTILLIDKLGLPPPAPGTGRGSPAFVCSFPPPPSWPAGENPTRKGPKHNGMTSPESDVITSLTSHSSTLVSGQNSTVKLATNHSVLAKI